MILTKTTNYLFNLAYHLIQVVKKRQNGAKHNNNKTFDNNFNNYIRLFHSQDRKQPNYSILQKKGNNQCKTYKGCKGFQIFDYDFRTSGCINLLAG